MNKVCAWVLCGGRACGFPTRTNNYHYNERYFLIRANYPVYKRMQYNTDSEIGDSLFNGQ